MQNVTVTLGNGPMEAKSWPAIQQCTKAGHATHVTQPQSFLAERRCLQHRSLQDSFVPVAVINVTNQKTGISNLLLKISTLFFLSYRGSSQAFPIIHAQ